MKNIAIALVQFNEKDLLDYGLSLTAQLNPGLPLTYFIANKTPYIPPSYPNFTFHDVPNQRLSHPCLDHSTGLEAAIKAAKQTKPDYLILTEPDFIQTYPIEPLITYMELADLAVMGTPYGKKARQLDVKKHNEPTVTAVPTIHFLIANLSKIDQFILGQDKQEGGKFIPYTGKVGELDTSIHFRQNLYRYKWQSFTMCLSTECSICRDGGLHIDGQFKEYAGKTEKLFFGNQLVGFHLQRYTSDNLDLLRENVKNGISNKFYHPLPNFL